MQRTGVTHHPNIQDFACNHPKPLKLSRKASVFVEYIFKLIHFKSPHPNLDPLESKQMCRWATGLKKIRPIWTVISGIFGPNKPTPAKMWTRDITALRRLSKWPINHWFTLIVLCLNPGSRLEKAQAGARNCLYLPNSKLISEAK